MDAGAATPAADRETVLKRDVPWEAYFTAKIISSTDLQLLRRYDNKPKEIKSNLLSEDGSSYIKTFLHCLKNISKDETIEYILAILDEILTSFPSKASLFFAPGVVADTHADIYLVLIKLLEPITWFIREKATQILTTLLLARDKHDSASEEKVPEVLYSFLEFLCNQIRQPEHETKSIPLAVNSLSRLLRDASARVIFCKLDGIRLLATLITPASSQQQMQLLYESILSVWFLTFCPEALDLISSTRIVPRLIEVAKSSPKEKVVRVSILSLKNLLNSSTFGATMVELSLHKVVQNLQLQAWSDEDLKEALLTLEQSLYANLKHLSSFDKYKAEVISGTLDWSPVHKDVTFWKDNILRFEDNDFQVLRVLVTLLESSKEPRTLAVACHDVGQFIATHPSGRQVALDLKAKERIMPLMAHPDSEVQKQSLLCIQKLLLSSKYASFISR